jgi:hypothetical protein
VTQFDFWVQGEALQNPLQFFVMVRSTITKKLLFDQNNQDFTDQ